MMDILIVLEELSRKYPNDMDLGSKVRILTKSDIFKIELEKIKEIIEKGKIN
jgi:hypothetical protein